jgi:CBS domain containing-hemolysin-like protein
VDVLEAVLVVALAFCFVGAATLAAVEVSIIRVRRSEILVDARNGDKRSQRLLRLLDRLPIVLNTVLLLVLLLQVAAATIGGFLAGRWFGGVGVTVMTVLMTAVLFVYAEAIPKTRAVRAPQQTALRSTHVLEVLSRLLRPVVAGLVRLADFHVGTGEPTFGPLTEKEIRALANEAAEAGEIAEDDAELVERSFEFNDRRVCEVMVPRNGIVAVAADDKVLDALSVAISAGHRRLPVHMNGLDDVVGVIRLRDLAAIAPTEPGALTSTAMSAVLRSHMNDPISGLLRRMQSSRQWLAVVVDDDERTMGLATIEDIVSELVGEIADDESPSTPHPDIRPG